MLRKIAKKLAIGASAIALASVGTAASAHMVQFGWEETTQGQLALFRQVLNRAPLTQTYHA